VSPRRIVGFHQDDEGHWVAELECGHTQHVRHDPPWQVREWVTTPEGRAGRLGQSLECRRCDELDGIGTKDRRVR
jgi:hypothetical protein